jgi:serine/threonine protein kinase
VHADIKPDNLLVDKANYDGLKLVDFGSAFSFTSSGNLSSATPEYLPPEALELLAGSVPEQISVLSSVSHPWSFDVWSLGMIVLEVASGLPLWLSFKARVCRGTKQFKGKGLLAVSGRAPAAVLREQFNVVENMPAVLAQCVGLPLGDLGLDFLSKLLAWHPRNRISPSEALEHPYLR